MQQNLNWDVVTTEPRKHGYNCIKVTLNMRKLNRQNYAKQSYGLIFFEENKL
jgi:hypothetical protein